FPSPTLCRSWLCASAVLVATASSGADVPYATTVSPITSGFTPSARASAAEPRISHSAPQYRMAIPRISWPRSMTVDNAVSVARLALLHQVFRVQVGDALAGDQTIDAPQQHPDPDQDA